MRKTTSAALTVLGATLATAVVAAPASAGTTSDIAALARANEGKTACSTNSLGGGSYYSSCTGAGGSPENWCADFARWVWANSGVQFTGDLNAMAASFYSYGTRHGTIANAPRVGDAAVFSPTNSTGNIQHVAIVTQVNSNGTIAVENGNFGDNPSVSRVVPATINSTVGSYSSAEGYNLVGYVAPVGVANTSSYASLAVYRPSNSNFYVRKADGTLLTQTAFGQTNDQPLAGHFEDSSYDNLAVYRPSEASFYIRKSDGTLFTQVFFGQAGDLPLVGHFEDSAYDNLAVYRPSEAAFYIRKSDGTVLSRIPFGQTGDIPLAGHFENNAYDNLAVYRPSNNTFYIRKSDGTTLTQVAFGQSGDIPVAGHFEDNAFDNLAVYRPSNDTYYIRKSDGTLLTQVVFGEPGDLPVVGYFQ
ncbi:CHAP domain-containing protein [Kutzneria chonburiensis]|uniref:CHAP domain-containing protein n=2 Tax=Kutzneria chonburiensis TaxID=1483604 RepID=A0ABV6MPP5_9PSEU